MFQKVFGIDTTEDAVEKVGMTEWGVIEKVIAEQGSTVVPSDDVQHQIPEEAYRVWAEALEEKIVDRPSTLLPGMWELVEALYNQRDIKLGVLTGNSYWRSEVKLKAIGMDEFFRERSGRIIGSFGNEARTRHGLLAFAQDRLVFDNDTLGILDDSIIGAQMLRGYRDIYAIFVATGHATLEQLSLCERPVFPDLGEGRWQQAYELLMKYV